MICRRGDIVLVPFPFTALASTKQCLALIVSADHEPAAKSDVVWVVITSQVSGLPTADKFPLTPADLQLRGLLKPLLARTTKRLTLRQGLPRRVLSHLPEPASGTVLAAPKPSPFNFLRAPVPR